MLCDSVTNGDCSAYGRAINLWESEPVAERILIPQLYVPSKYPLYSIDRDLRRRCQEQVGDTGNQWNILVRIIWCWTSHPCNPSIRLQMLGDLVACSSGYHSTVMTECVQWSTYLSYIVPWTPEYTTYLLSQAFSASSFIYRLQSWSWGRPGNKIIVMRDVCKWEKLVLWNTNAPCNSFTLNPQCTAFP